MQNPPSRPARERFRPAPDKTRRTPSETGGQMKRARSACRRNAPAYACNRCHGSEPPEPERRRKTATRPGDPDSEAIPRIDVVKHVREQRIRSLTAPDLGVQNSFGKHLR